MELLFWPDDCLGELEAPWEEVVGSEVAAGLRVCRHCCSGESKGLLWGTVGRGD